MSSFSILHLSDVHFGQTDNKSEQARITEAVISAIKEDQIKSDLIVFSGDLAYCGDPLEFQLGQDWLHKIKNLTGGKIAICPGNHDVFRPDANKSDLRLAHPTSASFQLSRNKICKRSQNPHLKNFFQWHRSYSEEDEEILPFWTNDDNYFADIAEITKENALIRVIALNTSALSCDNEDEEKLVVDISSLNNCLAKCQPNTELVVVIGHHPLNGWLSSWSSSEIQQILKQETGAHLYLHGHCHKTDLSSTSNNQGQQIVNLEGGACYQGSEWPQFFGHYQIDMDANKITPSIYKFSHSSGKWHKNNEMSREFVAILPKIPKDRTTKSNTASPSVTKNISGNSFDNPFDDVITNSLSPHIIPKLFVDENNFLHRVSNKIDSIVEGQRGTGKTMLLRYLSIDVVAESHTDTLGLINHLNMQKIPTGIYTRISDSIFNRSDTKQIKSSDREEAIFLHRLSIFLISHTVKALNYFNRSLEFSKDQNRKLSKVLSRTLAGMDLDEDASWDEIQFETEQICDSKIEEIDEHLASLLPGGTPIPFNPRLTVNVSFMSLLRNIKNILDLNVPFFLLLDDFDVLTARQQELIFSVAAVRNLELCCFKFGIMSLGQKTSLAGQDRTYRSGDDFDHITLSWIDGGLSQTSSNYRKTVELIAAKRIEASNWSNKINYKTMLNSWTHGNNIRKNIKRQAKEDYDSAVGSKPETFDSFWTKQGDMLFFRQLKKKKVEHRYAGVNDVVDLSSGIFRQFLEINSQIVSAALDSNWEPSGKKSIGVEIQNSAIREYSNNMLRTFGESGSLFSRLDSSTEDLTSREFINFTKSIIWLFQSRLYGNTNDGEVTAISIRGDLNENKLAKAILDVAFRESILQRKKNDYSAKNYSEGRLPTYYLNKRLAPIGNLGLKMQGRIEIEASHIVDAALSPDLFKQRFEQKSRSVQQDPNQSTFKEFKDEN
jgi:Cdc6-like AAA superfamily ATPase